MAALMSMTLLHENFRDEQENMFFLNFVTGDQKVGVLAFIFLSADNEVDSVMMFEYMRCVSGL